MNDTTKQTALPSHTPGPWEAWDDDGTGTLPCVLAKQVTSYGNFYVAQCNVFEDAKLIAAAPDLLEALESLLSQDEYALRPMLPAVRDKVYAALKKARGQ